MNARPLLLVAAALGFTASQYVLWRQWLYTTRVLAEIQRREGEHRCPVVPAAAPVPGEAVFLGARMPEYPRLTPPPLTDPALKDSHA